jgi:hypothetical protein
LLLYTLFIIFVTNPKCRLNVSNVLQRINSGHREGVKFTSYIINYGPKTKLATMIAERFKMSFVLLLCFQFIIWLKTACQMISNTCCMGKYSTTCTLLPSKSLRFWVLDPRYICCFCCLFLIFVFLLYLFLTNGWLAQPSLVFVSCEHFYVHVSKTLMDVTFTFCLSVKLVIVCNELSRNYTVL